MVSGLHVYTGDVMCVYMCVGRGEMLNVLLNKYVCVHTCTLRGEKGCVYVHVHAWVKDFIYWLISMCVFVCVYMCMGRGEWLHDTLCTGE